MLSKYIFLSKGVYTRSFVILIGVLSSLLASSLLLDVRRIFFLDWNNHLWLSEYFGESMRHFSIPLTINTRQIVGMPDTLFYAQKFYVFAGCLSAFLGSAITIRLLVLGTFLFQYFHIYRAAIRSGSAQKIAMGIALFVTWAIYPLTNLYNRSALTEFFAVAFLTCSVCSLLCVIINGRSRSPAYDFIATGFFFVLAAIIHPLTALFGGILMGVLAIITLFYCEGQQRQSLLVFFSLTFLFSLLILSPWIFMVHQFSHQLAVASHENNARFFHDQYFFPQSIDNIWSRLSPFPLDLKSVQKGVQDRDVFTPFLDAQITLPLIVLIGIYMYIIRREKGLLSSLGPCEGAIITGSAVILLTAFIESICPKAFDWLGGIFDILQFPYRLVTYVNLSALVIVILLAGRIGERSIHHRQLINTCLVFCIALSFSAVIQKLVHGSAISQDSTKVSKEIWAPLPMRSDHHLNELPATYYGLGAYTVREGFEKGKVTGKLQYIIKNFNVLEGTQFGHVEPLIFTLHQETLVVTNVEAFPWNHLLVNGRSAYPYPIIVLGGQGAILLPQGTYRLDFLNQADGIWKTLNLLSWLLILGWGVLYMSAAFKEECW